MSSCCHNDREYWAEFIEIYRQQPCLWNMKTQEYSDRAKKTLAYSFLIRKLREKDPSATRETVIKKINSFRSSFRKECRKVVDAERSGRTYTPLLWYYDQLAFVNQSRNLADPYASSNDHEEEYNLEIDSQDPYSEMEGVNEPQTEPQNLDNLVTKLEPCSPFDWSVQDDEQATQISSSNSDQNPLILNNDSRSMQEVHSKSMTSEHSIREHPVRPRSKEPAGSIKKPIHNFQNTIQNIPYEFPPAGQIPQIQSMNDWDIAGRYFASKLRKLPTDTQLLAEKLMNDVLFEAQRGLLSETTRICSIKHTYEDDLPKNGLEPMVTIKCEDDD